MVLLVNKNIYLPSELMPKFPKKNTNKEKNMIEHTVTFSLKHASGSQEEHEFLDAAAELSSIPKVNDFCIRRQISPKNSHEFGISMKFAKAAELQAYSEHPAHQSFIKERWLTEVSDFQESDFEAL